MKITFKKPSLKKEYLTILVDSDNISEKDKNDISLVTDKIEYYLCIINKYKLLLDNKRKIPNSVFLNIISNISNIKLEKEDYLKILSKAYNKNYNKIKTINTSMFANKKKATRISYDAAIDENFDFINNKIFTLDEITSLTKNKDIVLLKEKLNIDKIKKYDIIEKHTKFETIDYNTFMFSGSKIYKYTLEYIKDNISKDLLNRELNDFILKLKEEINDITNNKYLIKNSNIISNDIKDELEERKITLKL